MTERASDGHLFNASVLLGPNGVIGSYRKVTLWDTSNGGNEHLVWSRGSQGGVVLQSPLGKVGVMISTELPYYTCSGLVSRGADFLATVAAWTVGLSGWYEGNTIGNATATGRWHIVADQTGAVGHVIDYGHSRIIDPSGNVVADTGSGEGMAVAQTTWKVCPTPLVDFNGDGVVDMQDLLRMIGSWGQNDPSVEIAPLPFGDGKVDEKDLEVLMSHWE